MHAPKSLWPILKNWLKDAPTGVSGVECSNKRIGCVWDEGLRGRSEQQAVDELKQWLTTFQGSVEEMKTLAIN